MGLQGFFVLVDLGSGDFLYVLSLIFPSAGCLSRVDADHGLLKVVFYWVLDWAMMLPRIDPVPGWL